MTEYKLFKELCKRFPNSTIELQKFYNKYGKDKTKNFQLYIDKANLWKYDWSDRFKTIEELVEHLNKVFEENNIEKIMKKESERITELEKSYRYEKQIEELQKELFECYDNLDGLNAELDELRSHHNKLKNHWLVKLLRL